VISDELDVKLEVFDRDAVTRDDFLGRYFSTCSKGIVVLFFCCKAA